MSWSADQLRWLRALGHEPMLLASSLPAPARAATPALREERAVAPAGTSASRANRGDALAAALARAAGGRDLASLAGELDLDLDRLRREPALKRALWPKLRALRRGH